MSEDVWVIEFRSGTYFQNLEAYDGGPKDTAHKFGSKSEAERFMDANQWMWFNGGMATPFRQRS